MKKIVWILVLAAVLLCGCAESAQLPADTTAVPASSVPVTTVPTAAAPTDAATETTGVSEQETHPPESQAPDFTVYDADGNAHRLSDFFGKPIVLNFWASWCGPCKMEMPDFDAAYLDQGDEITFLMVNLTDGVDETVEGVSGFIDEQGYSFPVYFDSDFSAANTYMVQSIPMTFFIDENGYLQAYADSMISAELLQQGIAMITP